MVSLKACRYLRVRVTNQRNSGLSLIPSSGDFHVDSSPLEGAPRIFRFPPPGVAPGAIEINIKINTLPDDGLSIGCICTLGIGVVGCRSAVPHDSQALTGTASQASAKYADSMS